MATAVRPPGYYTSWLHVIANIPSTQNLNLYTWIGDWTARNYGHRWTNASKKLNAILTIPSNAIISVPDYSAVKLNNSINVNNVDPAITISNSFRSYDRITIINKGKIIGAYGYRDYSGTSSFTPPVDISSSKGIIRTQEVTRVNLTAAAGGGSGANGNNAFAGGGGGGGGAGGVSTRNNITVRPGAQVTAIGGERGQNASFTHILVAGQSAVALVNASAGGNGTGPRWDCPNYPGYENYCASRGPFGICLNRKNRVNPPCVLGQGGPGGSNLITGAKNGNNGTNGGTGGQKYFGNRAFGPGGIGGVGAGGNGGNGGTAYPQTNGQLGNPGWFNWSYTQRQLFGPAIKNSHTNIRLINDGGEIAGGYSDGQTIYAVYGASLFTSAETDWDGPNNNGTIFPASPGLQP